MSSETTFRAGPTDASLIRLRGSSREPSDGPSGRPTARERELIALIARGLSNKVIAHEMGISPNTVRAHVGNIMRKYKLRNRVQIAMLLMPMVRESPARIVRSP